MCPAQSRSLAKWVIFCGALSAKRKLSGVSFFQFSIVFSDGIAMKSVIDLRRGKAFREKRQHLRRRQILRVKCSFPFRVLETGGADPGLHAVSEHAARGPA